MVELFFSLSSDILFIAVLKENKCLAIVQRENKRLHSENFFFYLKKALRESKVFLKDLKEIYFTSNFGGQTGSRVSLAFILVLQILNSQIRIYHINSLLFQAGKGKEKTISLLTVDSKGSKYHAAIYQDGKCLKSPQLITSEELELLKKESPTFFALFDFNKVNFLNNFFVLKNYFQELLDIKKVNC